MKSKRLIAIHKQFFNEMVTLTAPMKTRIGRVVAESHPGLCMHLNGLLIQYIKRTYKRHNIDIPIGFALYLWKTKNITYATDRYLDSPSLLDSPFMVNFCFLKLAPEEYDTLRATVKEYEAVFDRAIVGWATKCKSAGMPAVVDGFEFFERDMDELIGKMKLLQ